MILPVPVRLLYARWRPATTPALWTRYYAPSETPAWVQPTGAHDSWPLGAHVTHNGHEWESLIPDNVWEPGAPGTAALWRQVDAPPQTSEWTVGVAYKVGDRVTYQGNIYESTINANVWAPDVYPAGWELIGPA